MSVIYHLKQQCKVHRLDQQPGAWAPNNKWKRNMVRGNHRQSTTSHCRFRWVVDVDFKCICYRTVRTPWSGIPSKTKLKEKSLKDSDNYLEIRSVCERVFHEKYDRKMCKVNHKTRNFLVPLCLLAWSFIISGESLAFVLQRFQRQVGLYHKVISIATECHPSVE